MKQKYQRPFFIIIGIAYFMLFVSVMGAILFLGGCSQGSAINPEDMADVIPDPMNLIKLQSDDIVILDNGHGRYDSWWIKSGVTFEIIIHEPENYTRMYNDSDFTISAGRAYTVGEGKYHLLDFTALNPNVSMYYFQIEVIINGISTTTDYVVDSN